MKVRIIAGAIVLNLICGYALAEKVSDEWMELSDSPDYKWYGKKKSGVITNLDNVKNNSYSYVIQTYDKKEKTYTYNHLVVELNSCRRGYGYVYLNNMEGKYLSRTGFVRFGSTVGDTLGSTACTSWDSDTGKTSMSPVANAWEEVASSNDGNKWSIKNDTVRKVTYNNKPAVSVLFSFENVAKKQLRYNEFVISIADCKRGYGNAYELDFNGKLVEKSDVVSSGNSVLAATISALCSKI